MASLPELVRACEAAAGWIHPARVAAVALHTQALDAAAAQEACARAASETGLPATDPVRFDPGPIAEAILQRESGGSES